MASVIELVGMDIRSRDAGLDHDLRSAESSIGGGPHM
jgi:hypothetical protein